MADIKTIGFNADTHKNLLIDAGAVWKNYGLVGEKLIGATSGGNSFEVKPNYRDIKIDGVKGNAKGLKVLTNLEITLKTNLVEVTSDILSMILVGQVDTTTDTDYDIITGRTAIIDSDYLENVAIVGTISGSDKPVIIIVKNALSTDGLTIKTEDDSDNTLAVTFTGHIDPSSPAEVPYEIRFPKVAVI